MRTTPQPSFALAVTRGLGKIDLPRLLADEAKRRRGYRKRQFEGSGPLRRSDAPLRARLRLA